jgi:hypothetical protein
LVSEKESDPSRVPTRENLLLAMRWLTEGCAAGDSLVFQFAGHGVQQVDLNDGEVDGYNEALCPVDFERSGNILDDEINETIVRPLGRGVKLHAVMDTCHSGTVLDLPFLCRLSRYVLLQLAHTKALLVFQLDRSDRKCDTNRHAFQGRGTGSGRITTLVGRGSAPTAAWSSPSAAAGTTRSPQTPAYVMNTIYTYSVLIRRFQRFRCFQGFPESASIGAMMDSFIQAVDAEPGTTYGRLLSAMRARIRDGHGCRRLPGKLGSYVRRMTASSGVQVSSALVSCSTDSLFSQSHLLWTE